MSSVARERVRLAELVSLLSLGTDLGLGQPMEHMIRACLIALRLGERLGLAESERGVVYYSGLLAWVGCHTDAYEQAKWFGNDATLKRDAHYHYDMGKVGPAISFMLRHVGGPERPLATRTRVGLAFMGDGLRAMKSLAENHYRATDELVERLGLGDDVRESLRQTYERWDGKVGGQVTYWARGQETGGAVTVLETVAVPGSGPPLHTHVEDEFIYVIEGRLRFRVEDAIREMATGSFAFIPRHVIHTWQSVGDVNARFLFGYAPESRGMERFFERGAELPDDSRLAEAFSRFADDAGMEVVGPPLA